MDQTICKQGAISVNEPFEVKSNGIFYKNTNWGLEFIGINADTNTTLAIKNCLNQAYQKGYTDGVTVGLSMNRI